MLLITGVNGHTGRLFLERLNTSGFRGRIRCLIRAGHDLTFIQKMKLNIEIQIGDLTDQLVLKKIVIDVKTVLHIAGIQYSEQLIKMGMQAGVDWFICVHTTGRYSKFKSAAARYIQIEDALLKQYDNLTLIRPTLIYGSSQDRNMWKLIQYIKCHKIFPIFGLGNNLFQPVHADDLAQAYELILNHRDKTFNQQYNLAGRDPISYKTMLSTIARELNKKLLFVYIPIGLSIILVYLYNVIFRRSAQLSVEQVLRMKEDRVFSWEKARLDFGYDPMSFEAGIRKEIHEKPLL